MSDKKKIKKNFKRLLKEFTTLFIKGNCGIKSIEITEKNKTLTVILNDGDVLVYNFNSDGIVTYSVDDVIRYYDKSVGWLLNNFVENNELLNESHDDLLLYDDKSVGWLLNNFVENNELSFGYYDGLLTAQLAVLGENLMRKCVDSVKSFTIKMNEELMSNYLHIETYNKYISYDICAYINTDKTVYYELFSNANYGLDDIGIDDLKCHLKSFNKSKSVIKWFKKLYILMDKPVLYFEKTVKLLEQLVEKGCSNITLVDVDKLTDNPLTLPSIRIEISEISERLIEISSSITDSNLTVTIKNKSDNTILETFKYDDFKSIIIALINKDYIVLNNIK